MKKDILPKITAEDILVMGKILSEGQLQHKFAVRIQTVLNRSKGIKTNDVAEILCIHPMTVSKYVHRYNEGGLPALIRDKAPIPQEVVNEVCRIVCQEKPEHTTHWSTREIAKRIGISHTTVRLILHERGLKPHIVENFQFSTDPEFMEKLEDVVGLYLNPPENSVIFCVDEKSQIQALERSQPILPLLPGVPERQTHDYYRHGTTTLFAALDVISGKVIGECKEKHKAEDYISFLKLIDKKSPKKKTLHIVADNYSAHKTKEVKEYLESKEGRFVEHFIPTHSSWLNLVERWFGEITNKRIRRESWTGVDQLEKAILEYIKHWNNSGRRFVWKKNVHQISASIEKAAKGLS
jgi:transposase